MEMKKIVGEIVLVSLDINVWSGGRKLQPSDLKLAAGELPPTDLASLGSLRECDRDALKVFDTLRKRAQTACARQGINKFLGGYAIPKASFPPVAAELDEIQQAFEDAKDDFKANYADYVSAWCTAHPGWETIIRRSLKTADEAADCLHFAWDAAMVKATDDVEPIDEAEKIVNEKVAANASTLKDKLYREIAVEAKRIEDELTDLSTIRGSSLNSIRRLRSKVEGLAFIDTLIAPVGRMIASALDALPSERVELTASQEASVFGLLSMLSDKEKLMKQSKRVLAGEDPAAALQGSMFSAAFGAPRVVIGARTDAAPVSQDTKMPATVALPPRPKADKQQAVTF